LAAPRAVKFGAEFRALSLPRAELQAKRDSAGARQRSESERAHATKLESGFQPDDARAVRPRGRGNRHLRRCSARSGTEDQGRRWTKAFRRSVAAASDFELKEGWCKREPQTRSNILISNMKIFEKYLCTNKYTNSLARHALGRSVH
jgi:hypothetical protein